VPVAHYHNPFKHLKGGEPDTSLGMHTWEATRTPHAKVHGAINSKHKRFQTCSKPAKKEDWHRLGHRNPTWGLLRAHAIRSRRRLQGDDPGGRARYTTTKGTDWAQQCRCRPSRPSHQKRKAAARVRPTQANDPNKARATIKRQARTCTGETIADKSRIGPTVPLKRSGGPT
jgi:hypothetical protein